jgi:ParB-like chromosome segregation protein Spo0J
VLKRADQPYQVLPELPSWEYQALKESIRRYGVLLPVVKDEAGTTIDGHHREQACEELGIRDYPIITLHGLSEEQKRDHALLLNLVRRKVTRKQLREIIAAELRRTPDISSNWLAGLLGTTPRTVNSVRKELIATCEIPRLASYRGRDGKRRKATIVVTFKAKDAQRAREALAALGEDAPRKPTELRLVERRLRKKERLGEVEGQLKLPRPQEAIRLFHCPLQNFERSADIQPGTVNLVLTDIPYGREFLPQLPDLATFAQRVLAEGGIFATYCGVVDLPQVMEGIGRHLAYQAVAFSSWSGEGPLLHSTQCVVQATPVLVFSKGIWRQRTRWHNWHHNTTGEQDLHPWQKQLPDVEHWVHCFTEPGDLVCDPLAGSFTSAVACERLARRFIGCDQKRRNVLVGQERPRAYRQSALTG